MRTDPRVAPWARRFIPDDDKIDVTPREENLSGWYLAQAPKHRALRDAHIRSFWKRCLNTMGSFLLGAIIPWAAWFAWPVALGWGIAAGVSFWGIVGEQVILNAHESSE